MRTYVLHLVMLGAGVLKLIKVFSPENLTDGDVSLLCGAAPDTARIPII